MPRFGGMGTSFGKMGGASARSAKTAAMSALRAAGIIGSGGLDTLQVAEATGVFDWAGNYTPSPQASITFTAYKGYGPGNGTTQYVKSGYIPSTNGVNYTLNDASMWIWSLTDAQSSTIDAGNGTAPRTRITTRDGSNVMAIGINDASASSAAGATESLGLFGAQRTGATTKMAFKNGVQLGSTFTTASSALPTVELYYCGSNSGSFSTKQICMFAAGASLTGKEATFFSIMRTYFLAVKSIPYSIDWFGDSFAFNAAYLGDLPTVASFFPALLNTTLTNAGGRINGTNFAVAGANSGTGGTNLQAQISGARTPVVPKYAGIYIGQNDNAAGFSSATSQANIVTAATTLLGRGYAGIIIVGKHYDNLTSSADTTTVQLAANQTQRTFQAAAAAPIGSTAIYVDLYAWMRALIIAGTYTQGDHLWHEGATDTHPNAIGEQIIADAVYAAMQSAGWTSGLS